MKLFEYTANVNSKSKAWVNLDSVVQVEYVTGASSGDGLLLTLAGAVVLVTIADEIKEAAKILGITLPKV
jgi:hypothetical protein